MMAMYLTSSLLHKGHKVFGVDKQSNEFVGTNPNYNFVQCEITDKDTISGILSANRFDTVVHLACTVDNDLESFITDEEMKDSKLADKYLYSAASDAGVTAFVLLSTTQVYGVVKGREPIRETTPEKGSSNYVDMKLLSEKMLFKETKKSDMIPVVARVAPIYTADYTQNLRDRVYDPKEDVAFVIKDGEYGFTFCCLFNMIDFINGIVAKPSGRYDGIYNVCDTRPTTAREIVDYERAHHRIGAVIQKSITGISLPIGKQRAKTDYRYVDFANLLANWNYDNTKAQRISTFRWKLSNTK